MSSSGTTSASRRFERARDRRSRGFDEPVQLVDVLLAESPAAVAREDAEKALGLALAEQRHHEPGPHRLFSLGGDEVAGEPDLDGARAAVVGEPHAGDVVRLGLGEADRGDDRRPLAAGHERDRAVRRRPLARELERTHHGLGIVLELERRDGPGALERRERVVQRLRERREPVVVAAEHRRRDVRLPREKPTDREHEEDDRERREGDGRDREPGRHLAPARSEAGARPSIEVTLQRGVAGAARPRDGAGR